ncbi:homoserine kinase [Oceanobacillus massiliensis]|uniref:homoserine kinase n=1 Tax=Oceanobacillus massiliensis TaxID=1465765 RepID=UPI00028A1753|nr:homoserine kinase [Oceanobacillus massiliensis]
MKPFRISVPASSGNVGPGFDSMGLAESLYLSLEVKESDQWEFSSPSFPGTSYEDHFIYQIAKQTAERHNRQLPSCSIAETSDIPLARGLGSSASAILAGIELANQLCGLSLSSAAKLRYGAEIEGHPDNIAPALFGGLVISTVTKEEIDWIRIPVLDVDLVLYIPEVELKTEKARQVLPEDYPRSHASTASGISNIVIAALLTGDFNLAGRMMERDLFHEPYRSPLIPNYEEIRREAKKLGAYGTVISGAGPAMLSFVPKGAGQAVAVQMQNLLGDYQVKSLDIDVDGLTVEALY